LFVREVKQFRSSVNDDAVHPPTDRLEMEAEELKDVKIDAKLTITSNDSKMNTWYGFVSEGALFLKGNVWDDMDIREVSNAPANVVFITRSCRYQILLIPINTDPTLISSPSISFVFWHHRASLLLSTLLKNSLAARLSTCVSRRAIPTSVRFGHIAY